jgi:hypothetical protein
MAYFQTKNPNLDKSWRDFQWKMLVYVMTFWSILRPFGLFVAVIVLVLMSIWYIFTVLVCCSKKNLATLLHGRVVVS